MAVRVALFHAAPKPKAAQARARESAAAGRTVRADPKTGAVARVRAKLRPKAAEPEPEPPRKPAARKPAARKTAGGKTAGGKTTVTGKAAAGKPAGRKAGGATAPVEKPRSADRKSATATAPEGPLPPLLQRRSLGALLARAAVMAVAIVLMVAFAVALAKVTLVPSPASVHLIHTNLRPGASIRAYLDQPALRDTVKQIGGNIVLGVPFGILLPMLFPHTRGLLRVGVLTALVMVMVETTQGLIVQGRAFDIDDVILNTSGSLVGYLLLGRRLGRALHPRRTHWYQRAARGNAPPADEG